MNRHETSGVGEFATPHTSVRRLTIGFFSCIVLSLAAYIVATGALSTTAAVIIIGLLAAIQCIVQLVIFLHLGTESKPRWRLAIFWLMLTIIFIVVAGSLWIMDNLNHNMMYSPEQLQDYLQGQDGL